jgi:hypothetical protein
MNLSIIIKKAENMLNTIIIKPAATNLNPCRLAPFFFVLNNSRLLSFLIYENVLAAVISLLTDHVSRLAAPSTSGQTTKMLKKCPDDGRVSVA